MSFRQQIEKPPDWDSSPHLACVHGIITIFNLLNTGNANGGSGFQPQHTVFTAPRMIRTIGDEVNLVSKRCIL